MREISKVNFAICPKCKFRYQVGSMLLMEEGIPSVCPKCHLEYDSRSHIEGMATTSKVKRKT